jgi:glycosyltransferase involved in cell wall biosynthesis
MVRVAFDISAFNPAFKSHAQRGIGRYVSHLYDYLSRATSSGGPQEGVAITEFDHDNLINRGLVAKAIGKLPYGRTTIRQQLLYPFKLASSALRGVDFVHFPAHMDGPTWSFKPFILTVHDLIPLVLDKLYRANRPTWRYEFARWLENSSIRNAAALLSVSEATARDVERLLGIPRERIFVTPNGVEDSFFELFKLRETLSFEAKGALRNRLGIPQNRPIVLYVGGHDERKNIPMVIEIVHESIEQSAARGMPKPVLVLAGKIGSEREQGVLDAALRDLSMAADTVNCGFVPDDDLRALYAEAAVFLFPSLYEGFGLPVLEAMAAGLPVVSSDRGALPEVIGREGLVIDPEDPIAGCKAVLRILGDSELARNLSLSGHKRAREFTWERTGRLTLEAYREIARRRLVKRCGV